MTKIAINGFGRIGRLALRNIFEKNLKLEVVAINDLADSKTLAHLLKYDSTYRNFSKSVEIGIDSILVDKKEIKVFSEKDPLNLPWKKLNIDIVLECTGVFRKYEDAEKHLKAGAKKVIISAPSKNPEKIPSIVLGVNDKELDYGKYNIIDMGSCTTNCLAPIIKILNDNFKIVKGFMSTIHSYTNDQKILDLPHKDLRRARTAAMNIIPTTTGATNTIGYVIPELKGKLNGMAFRVPTSTVSIIDLVCEIEKNTTVDEINKTFQKASQEKNFQGILATEENLLVSSDYIGNHFSSIVDLPSTMVKDNLVKIVAWYDNEWAYALRLAEFAEFINKK